MYSLLDRYRVGFLIMLRKARHGTARHEPPHAPLETNDGIHIRLQVRLKVTWGMSYRNARVRYSSGLCMVFLPSHFLTPHGCTQAFIGIAWRPRKVIDPLQFLFTPWGLICRRNSVESVLRPSWRPGLSRYLQRMPPSTYARHQRPSLTVKLAGFVWFMIDALRYPDQTVIKSRAA